MKDINEYILEKFKINKDNVNNEYNLIDDIIEHIGNNDQELESYITKWINKNKIQFVRYVSSERDIPKLKISDEIKKDFSTIGYQKFNDTALSYHKKQKRLKNGYTILDVPNQNPAIFKISTSGMRTIFIVQDLIKRK